MSKWLPSLLTLIGSGVAIYNEQIQHFISGHPAVSIVVGTLVALLHAIAPSPLQAEPTK